MRKLSDLNVPKLKSKLEGVMRVGKQYVEVMACTQLKLLVAKMDAHKLAQHDMTAELSRMLPEEEIPDGYELDYSLTSDPK